MLNFLSGSSIFTAAVLGAAAGPVLIHLLNRRRFRVVNWAAMDFLLEALQRNRRLLHLRDLLLLALRTACVLLFGAALMRPYFSSGSKSAHLDQPIHAILIVDNSLSMGYEELDGTLLSQAKARANRFLEQLPEGSRASVLPLCGSAGGFSFDAYHTKEDARDALNKIEVVDRSSNALHAVELASDAMKRVPELPDKRVVFIGDQQEINWPKDAAIETLKDVPEMQVVAVAPREPENTWIDEFSVENGLADAETPAIFTAVVRHEGPSGRSSVPVSLSIDGTEVGSQTIDLQPGQSREVTFKYRFDIPVDPGKPVLYMPAKVSLPPDHLREDDARYLAVPIVAALPVLFIDQYGDEEDPKKSRYGETFALRRLLAPITQRGGADRQLVRIKHIKIDQLDQEELAKARLVVIAGIASPEGNVPLLREYVRQGGQLIVAAGADFDPVLWQQTAWQDGAGILPVPLRPETRGSLPEEAGSTIEHFSLSFASMAHDYFYLPDTPREELESLYGLPWFFKAVDADAGEATLDALVQSDAKHLEQEQQAIKELKEKFRNWSDQESKGTLTEEDRHARADAEPQLAALEPTWLQWTEPRLENDQDARPADLAERSRPRVLAGFDNGLPYLIERRIGRGQVLFAASGTYSSWNTLPSTNAMLLFDRILRGMIERTLPARNAATAEQITLAIPDRNAVYTLTRPSGAQEPLGVDALGGDLYGVNIRHLTERGMYKVTAARPDPSAETAGQENKLWEVQLAAGGPSQESNPQLLDRDGLRERVGEVAYRWVGPGEEISLEGAQVSGQNLWKWLIGLALVGLVAELALLARPMWGRERAA